jgi:hypothetical protein
VGYPLDLRPLDRGLPIVTFSVQMAVFPSTTTNQEWFDWTAYNTDAKSLFAVEFPTGSGDLPVYYKLGDGNYIKTGQSYSSGTAYTLTVTMDFASNRWSATLGAMMLVTNQPIVMGTNALTLQEMDADWLIRDAAYPGNDYMVFDQYQVTAAPAAAAGPATVYATRFDSSEGYHPGVGLVGQNGWIGSGTGGDGIITNGLLNYSQSAYVGYNPPITNEVGHSVAHRLNFNPVQEQLPLVTFTVVMAVFPSTTTNQDWFDWTVFETGKELFALSFPSGSGNLPISYQSGDGPFIDTSQTYTNGTAYTLKVTMDFAASRWNAMLGSMTLVTNQPLSAATGTNTPTLDVIMAEWVFRDPAHPGNDYMLFNDYGVTAEAAATATAPTLQLLSRSATGEVTLRLLGQPGTSYALEASSDLRTWTQLVSLSSPDGNSEFTDVTAGSLAERFYRARSTALGP